MHRIRQLVGFLALGTIAAACDRLPTAPNAVGQLSPSPFAQSLTAPTPAAPTPAFNPQPDPPRIAFRFDAVVLAPRGGGTFAACGGQGTLVIQTTRAIRIGEVIQLDQTWSFSPPDPCMPPVRATLRGTVDLKSGDVTLDGVADYGGAVHVRGTLGGSTGPASAGGTVMFNPQPDPPGTPIGIR